MERTQWQNKSTMQKLLVICGATATGKTAIGVHLAKMFDGELVSADSRQVYEGMDIGTGKDLKELKGVPLWMIDVVKPDEEYSVSHFTLQATAVIDDIQKRNKLPIIVGGTGFYIRALLHPFETLHVPPDNALRLALSDAPVAMLQKKLVSLDKNIFHAMNKSDQMNPRRLIRKIEIASGSSPRGPLGELQEDPLEKDDVLHIGLTAPLKELYRRIDVRVEKRVAQGMKVEIQTLLRSGYSWDLPSMHALGYIQWKDAVSEEEVITRWKYDEHAYARRQMTWLHKEKDIVWFDVATPRYQSLIEKLVREWYTKK